MEFNWPLFWYLFEGFTLLRNFIFLVTRAVVHTMMDISSMDGSSVDKAFSADNSIPQFPVQTKVKQRGLAVTESIKTFGKGVKQRGLAVTESIKSFGKGILNATEKTRCAEHASSLDEFMSGCTFNPYIGLPNEGNTCFLNSLLQCLYLTPEFRDKLSKCENNRGETLLAVENIFNALEEKEMQNVTTWELTVCLGLKPFKQQDVPEVFHLLLNKLDDELSNGSYFKELYASTMVSLTECTQCKTKDGLNMGCNIVILPLPVSSVWSREKRWSVTDALEHFLRSSEMKGDNQIYCSICGGKTDATLRQALTSLPRILVVQLKRFEFSFYEQRFVKLENKMHINTTLEVPCENTSQKDKMSYDLFAICDHYGGFKSGHYSALIKPEENDKWFCFNDSTVTPTEISDPENRDPWLDYSSSNKYDLSSSRTAYVLMYRQKLDSEPQKSEGVPDPSDLGAPQPSAPPLVISPESMEDVPLRSTQKTQNWPTISTIPNVCDDNKIKIMQWNDKVYLNTEQASTSQIPLVEAKPVQPPDIEAQHEVHNAGQTFNAQTHQNEAAEHNPNMQTPRNELEAEQKSIMHTHGLEAFPSIQLALHDVKRDPESSTVAEAPLVNLTGKSCSNVQTHVDESVPGVQVLPGDVKSDPESFPTTEAPLINLTGESCSNVQTPMANTVSCALFSLGDRKSDLESFPATEVLLINLTGESCSNVQTPVDESVPGVQVLSGDVKSDPESFPATEAPLVNLTGETCSNVQTPMTDSVPGVKVLSGDMKSDTESFPATEAPLVNLTGESCSNVQTPMADSVSCALFSLEDRNSDLESFPATEAPLVNLTDESCSNVQTPMANSVYGALCSLEERNSDLETFPTTEALLINMTGDSCSNVQTPMADSVSCALFSLGDRKSDPESFLATEAPLINLTGESCSNVHTPMADSVSCALFSLGDRNSDLESFPATEALLINLTGESCYNVQTPVAHSFSGVHPPQGDQNSEPEPYAATETLINQASNFDGSVQTPVADLVPEQREV